MFKGNFKTSALLIDRIPLPYFGIFSLIFFLDQLYLGESLVAPGLHVVSMFLYVLNFNLLRGLKTIAGSMLSIYATSNVGAYSLICMIARIPMSDMMDPDQEILILNLGGAIALTAACYVFSRMNLKNPLVEKVIPLFGQNTSLPEGVPTLVILTAMTVGLNVLNLPDEARGFTAILSPTMFLVAWRLFADPRTKKPAMICMLLVLAMTWASAGLSGMKSSLLLPLMMLGGTAAMVKVQVKRSVVAGFVAVFVGVSVVAFAIQPLRNLKMQVSNEMRLQLALALLLNDLDTRYDIKVDVGDRKLRRTIDRIAYETRKAEKGNSAGALNRLSYFKDDSKLVQAVQRKGELPLEKYFDETVLVPRSVSGDNQRDDRLSAYHGRYAEILGRTDRNTGIAFSSHIVAFAHGGYTFMMAITFISALMIFVLTATILGTNTRENDFSILFTLGYLSALDHGLSVLSLWHMTTRMIPILVVTYFILNYVTQILARYITFSEPLVDHSSPVENRAA
jgi:hypothetical protein